MTKLGLLNAYLTERLMVAVREILEVVEGTVSEYQEEAARTHRENEKLRRRLQEIGLDTVIDWSGAALPLSLSAAEGSSPAEQRQHGEQEWSSGLREEELALSKEEQEQPPRTRSCDLGLAAPDYDAAARLPTAPHVKSSDEDAGPGEPPDLFRIRVVDSAGAYSPPGLAPDSIKTEPGEVYCGSTKLSGPTDAANPVGSGKVDATVSGEAGADPPPPPPSRNRPPDGGRSSGRACRKMSHSCPHCGKTFRHVSRLKIHLRIHTGEKPFGCPLCGKCFNNDGTLKNHQRVHMQVRLYRCAECGMSFKDAYTCKKHQRVHTGEKPYCCHHCGKHFNEAGNLQTHVRKHTGERPFCCTLCGKRFMELGKLKRHFLIHTRAGAQS